MNKKRLHFPTLTTETSTLDQTQKRNTSSLSSSFYERNYVPAVTKAKKALRMIMMSQEDLHALYYRFKKYYNEINSQTSKNEIDIYNIKEENKKIHKRICNIEKSKDICVNGKEKISIVHAKEEPEVIEKKMTRLENEKSEIEAKLLNEGEYSQTIKHMIENEESHLAKLDKEILITRQRIKDLDLASRTITSNLDTKAREKKESALILCDILNEIEKNKQMMEEQHLKQEKLKDQVLIQEEKVAMYREKIKEETTKREEEIEKYKQKVIEDIREYQYKKEKKEQKEYDYINFILGLRFFQKYFVFPDKENKEIDTVQIKNSKAYKYFLSKKQKVVNDETVKEIKEKFDEVQLTYDDVFNYYNKMNSLVNFTRENMNLLNKKQIELTTRKERATRKVKDIINRDIKNLDDLISNNERFKKFIENNQSLISKASAIRSKNYNSQVNTIITEDEYSHPDKKLIDKTSNVFIVKCNKAKRDIKYYIESMIDSIRVMNYIKEGNDINEEEEGASSLYNDFIINSSCAYDNYELTPHKQYVKDIVLYGKENKIKNADKIYSFLFTLPKSERYLSHFLKKDILYDPFIFYFFNQTDKRKKMIELIEKLNKLAIAYKPALSDKDCTKFLKKKASKRSSKKEILFFKNLISKPVSGKPAEKRRLTLEEQINNDYHYDKSDDEYENEEPTISQRLNTCSTITTSTNTNKRLYNMSLKRSQYLRDLRERFGKIEKDTSKYRHTEIGFKRSWRDVNQYKHYFEFYNDPKLNVQLLSNNTYRFLSKEMLSISKGKVKVNKKTKPK